VIGGLGAFATPAMAQPPPPGVADCYDGTCTVTVSGPVEIPLDGRAGFTSLSVAAVGPHAVTFVVRQPSGPGLGVVGAGGTARFGTGTGTLAVHVLELTGSTARLELTTTVP
jgi:hypothetical protein